MERVYGGSDPFAVLIADIVESLDVGDRLAPTASGVAGAEAVAVMEAAYKSNWRNESVVVDYSGVE